MNTTTETDRNAELTALGFSLETTIPAGRVDDGWPCISYNVTLKLKGKTIIEAPYRLGVGHVNVKKAGPDMLTRDWTTDEQSMLYAWQGQPHAKFKDKQRQANIAAKLARRQGVKPALADVVHSLLMDGEAFFNAQSFEDWAVEYGYGIDSRKAESIYRLCDATGRKLAASVPTDVLAKAREILQDY